MAIEMRECIECGSSDRDVCKSGGARGSIAVATSLSVSSRPASLSDSPTSPSRPDLHYVVTRDYITRMKTIGIRELKARLSQALREVAAGEVMLITDRGRVVAEFDLPSRRPRSLAPRAGARSARRRRANCAWPNAHDIRTGRLPSSRQRVSLGSSSMKIAASDDRLRGVERRAGLASRRVRPAGHSSRAQRSRANRDVDVDDH